MKKMSNSLFTQRLLEALEVIQEAELLLKEACDAYNEVHEEKTEVSINIVFGPKSDEPEVVH